MFQNVRENVQRVHKTHLEIWIEIHARVADERKLSDIVNIHIKLETSKLFFL